MCQTLVPDFDGAVAAAVAARDVGGHDDVLALRVLAAEGLQVGGVEAVGGPFALDGQRRGAPAPQDEIDLVPALVAPVLERDPFIVYVSPCAISIAHGTTKRNPHVEPPLDQGAGPIFVQAAGERLDWRQFQNSS